MKKEYITCDIEKCREEVKLTNSSSSQISDLDFYDNIYPGKKYCWVRLGILNGDFCPKHRAEIMKELVDRIKVRYDI